MAIAIKTLTVVGGNLYQIAEQLYGDATFAIALMQANNLTDYLIDGQVTLIIPPYDSSYAGGLPQ
jgi:hypothetical protein